MPNMRDWMNNNSALVTVGAVLVLLVALGVIMWTSSTGGRSGGSNQVYFYDVTDGKLFPMPHDAIPPVDAPSGPDKGVRALVFTYDGCGESERFIAYLEKYTDKAKEQLLKFKAAQAALAANPSAPAPQGDPEGMDMAEMMANPNYRLVREPGTDDKTWYPSMSPMGMKVMQFHARHPKPQDKDLKSCTP